MHISSLPIQDPCSQDWSAMTGDEQKRFCGKCTKHVHDLSQHTERSARKLVSTSDDLCVRYSVQRRTGQISFRPSRRQRVFGALAAAVSLLTAAPAFGATTTPTTDQTSLLEQLKERLADLLGSETEDVDETPAPCDKPIDSVWLAGDPVSHIPELDTVLEEPPEIQPERRELRMGRIARPTPIQHIPDPVPPVEPEFYNVKGGI
jgi:hypothetical protein